MRDWLNSLLGQDGGRIAQFVLALIAVLLLVLLVAWVARRLLPGDRITSANSGKSRKRLGVLEASDVDARRRLVLVRRDDVEHLIMIGGPNDLLIESRILRGQQAMRPGVQPGQRPQGVIEPDRTPALSQQPQPAVTAPTAPTPSSVQLAPLAVTSSPMHGPDGDNSVKPDAPTSPPAPPPVQFAASNTAPSMLRPMAQTTPKPTSAQLSPEPRRASMNDLLNAAAAARQSDQRELTQPITVPPPPPPRLRQPQPDLEEDDRDMPTQIVAHRTMQPPSPALPADKPVELPDNRATDVSTQIERALADLNPLVDERISRAEPKVELTPVASMPVRQQSPTLQSGTAPVSTAATPSMPSIAPRPTPPVRPTASERPSLADRPPVAERPHLPDRSAQIERTAPQLHDRLPMMERAPVVAAPNGADEGTANQAEDNYPPINRVPSREPVTAPRPVTAPVQPQAIAANELPAASPPVKPPVAPSRPKTDELEEEMAKLLSELGGPSSR